MPKVLELSSHVANLIAAGEVVERPASAVKELLENAVDAGATKVTVEIQNGGMTLLRVTDNGCGMEPEDAVMAFRRHATSKLRSSEDLAAVTTMGFRGEALAAIASVSRIDLLTRTEDATFGVSLHLEAGVVTEQEEAGCPVGTTILVRNLFYNTPARMKFMKSDTVEGSRVAAVVQQQALAHPDVAFTFLRDGKQVLSTPGTGGLDAAAYSIFGRDCAKMVKVDSRWDAYRLFGFVTKPTDARPSRNLQAFFVNNRPVKSKLLTAAVEEAYRNQIMSGKFPGCVLHLVTPANAVDVNVHPAKTEVKFLAEHTVFDCVHYAVLGALNTSPDRPDVRFRQSAQSTGGVQPRADAFRTMTAEEYRNLNQALKNGPKPAAENAAAAVRYMKDTNVVTVRDQVILPTPEQRVQPLPRAEKQDPPFPEKKPFTPVPRQPEKEPRTSVAVDTAPIFATEPKHEEENRQTEIPMPPVTPWRLVGELYRSYILVEQGDEAFLIDKHAAHERILFDRLKENQERISGQTLLAPIPCTLSPEVVGELLGNRDLLQELGFEIQEFGQNTVLIRQLPMELSPEDGAEALEALGADLLSGRRERKDQVRDELLHTVACKAAIKAGWQTDERELLALVSQVMSREDLKYCPHGRPICVSLSKKQLEKQFRRS